MKSVKHGHHRLLSRTIIGPKRVYMLLYDERFGDAKITGWGLPEYKIKRKDMTSEAYVHHVAAEWEKFVHGQMNKADNGMSYKKLPPIKESSDLIRRIWTVVDPAETKRRYQHV